MASAISTQRKHFSYSVHYSDAEEDATGVSCTSCHSAHDKSTRGSMLSEDWRLSTIKKCLTCHKDHSEDYLNSRHYKEVVAGNERAPICTDCHGIHELYSVNNPSSKVNVANLSKTCDSCHSGHESTLHRKADVDPRLMTCVACHTGHSTQMNRIESVIFKETIPVVCNRCHLEGRHKKEDLAHGKIMYTSDENNSVNCTDCHKYHWRLSDEDNLKLSKSGKECQDCHRVQSHDYENSVHGIAFRKGHEEAPTCKTCHEEREIERTSERFDGQETISLCGSCHGNSEVTMKFQLNDKVVSGYLNTYHGQVYSLGYQGKKFATCTSCHDNHLILSSDNPQSTISRAHIIETCGKCHEDANENFVGMLQHYDPMHEEESTLLKFIHLGMVWLLGGTLSVFGLHTLLWLIRALIERVKNGPAVKDPKYKNVRYVRFKGYERFLHVLVIISFLLLAMTGLPLKYSHSEASQWIAANLFDLHTMAIMHRVGAVITAVYFALHLGRIFSRIVAKRLTLQRAFWGEDSLVPQPRDAKEFIQHTGYFLGLCAKPEFGRWSYWEKFDYLAVFWGVTIIGLSGLTLWFPEFFTQILPGWAINAAHIIHSEEALLATGFIFTIHFFNEHLRPDNFPFDEVIFTGSLSRHYMTSERKRWFDQLKEQGKLKQIEVPPMKIGWRILVYIFGFASLAVGLALLALIIIGTFG